MCRSWFAALGAAVLLGGWGAGVGCRPSSDSTSPTANAPGSVSVQWQGGARGSFVAPGVGTWCPVDSLLEVLAVRGDSGFGFALAVPDSIRAISHPVIAPSMSVSWRPLAVAALRWVTDTAVRGFEATGGTIAVTEVTAAGVSGSLDLRLRRIDAADTVRLTGTFDRVLPKLAEGSCGRLERPGILR